MSSMRFYTTVAQAAVLLLVSPLANQSEAQSACLGPTPPTTSYIQHVTTIVTATDTASARIRTAFGLLQTTASEVYLVSDSVTCHNAAIALERVFGDSSGTAAPVWLVRAGPNRLVAYNRQHRDPYGTIAQVVFDTLFTKQAVITGF